MHINAVMSDCSPPGVSQMSVNIQLFPLHLTLISLWWHFISLLLAVLAGKRSEENRISALFIWSTYKNMGIQTNEKKKSLCSLGVEAGLELVCFCCWKQTTFWSLIWINRVFFLGVRRKHPWRWWSPSFTLPVIHPQHMFFLMATPSSLNLLFSPAPPIDSNGNKLPIQINTMSRSHPSRQKYLPSLIP